jgi:ribose/xylose/arabinose/galactoside ABC-type transport system permease subunit
VATLGVWVVLAVLVIVSASVSSSFLHTTNLLNIGRQSVPLAIVAIGEALVILVGGIDVSVGAVVTLTTCVAAREMAASDTRILPTVALVLGLGSAVGLVNGLLVAKLRTDAFVTTLATMLLVQGAALVYTQGSPANDLTHGFRQISEGEFLGVPISIYCFIGLFAVVWAALARSVWGRRIYAVGANSRVAHLSGQPVSWITVSAYVACSLLAAVGGLFLVARLGTGDTAAGAGWELQAIAAVLIGGTAFGGGKGGVVGPVGGVLVLTTLLNLVDLLALANYWKLVVKGAAIVIGVALYSRRRAP